jgi:hypothetical protein
MTATVARHDVAWHDALGVVRALTEASPDAISGSFSVRMEPLKYEFIEEMKESLAMA